MWKKRFLFLIPALVLTAAALIFLRTQKPEPVYIRTAAFGRLTENLEGDPFTVYRWDGGDSYVPVFTAGEEVWPDASAISGETLYYTATTEEYGGIVYRVDLQTGEKTCLGELDCNVKWVETCGEDLFLRVYDDAQRQTRMWVLREGEFIDCARAANYYTPISCDAGGCWYMDYDSETYLCLCYLPADTLVPEKVYENIPHPIELQAAPEGVYFSCQFGEDIDAGTFSLVFYPRDGSGAVKQLTERFPDGRVVTGEKREDLTPIFTLRGERLFYLTYIGWSKGVGEENVGYWLHCLDRKTGRVTDYGKIRADTGVGTVSFQYLLTFGKQGFLLNESNWWATEPEGANAWSYYTWSGKRTELHAGE